MFANSTHFWATVCKTVRPMLSDRCLSVCPVCLSVCYVGVLWPNGWMDQDEPWHAGRRHCSRVDRRSSATGATDFPRLFFWGVFIVLPQWVLSLDPTKRLSFPDPMMHEPHSQDLAPPLLMGNNCAGHCHNYYMNRSIQLTWLTWVQLACNSWAVFCRMMWIVDDECSW